MAQDREILFAKALAAVTRKAKEQGGMISQEEVERAFEKLSLSEEQFAMVFDYLNKNRIGIGEPLDPSEYLTEEETDYLKEYQKEIELLEDISEGEKEALLLSAMAGQTTAQERLIRFYLKKVVEISKLYSGQGVFLEDLIGEGNVALAMGVSMLGSLEKPSEAQGMLAKLMMDAMEDYIQENAASAKTDRKVADKVNLVADKARELAEELHRKVTPEELARETGLSLKAIQDACRMSGFKIEDIGGENEAVSL